mmetsp:Transcript_15338/g.62590  ORF Transcript_15338/g.62590 Transcript_15338/m.62590 type:complete len:81 (+) Transcript_15338:1631-1873(+)
MTTCWDEKGNENNVIISGKQNKNFTWDSWNARSVAIAGTFSDWKPVRRNHNSLSWLDYSSSCGTDSQHNYVFVITFRGLG